jgi:hypothetical protein
LLSHKQATFFQHYLRCLQAHFAHFLHWAHFHPFFVFTISYTSTIASNRTTCHYQKTTRTTILGTLPLMATITTAKSPKPSSHKRVDSGELGGIGAQFRRPSKADSIPRPSDIDIDDEAVQIPQPSAAGDLATGTHEDRSVSGVRGAHHYSKEDVALLIHHRDRGCEEGGMCISYSLMCSMWRGRCYLNIHSTFHPLVLIPTNLAPLSSS